MELSLKEKLVLLSLQDDKGSHEKGMYHVDMAFSACCLLDLIIAEHLRLENGKLILQSNGVDKNPIHRDILKRIRKVNRPKSIKHWISALGMKSSTYRKQVAVQLVHAGILYKVEKRFLGIKYYRYPTLNPNPENAFRKELLHAIENPKDMKSADLAMLAVLNASNSLTLLIKDKNRLKEVRNKVKNLVVEDEFGKAVNQAVQEMIAVLVTTVVVTTAVTS